MMVRYEPALPGTSYMVQAPLILDVEGQRIHSVDRWSLEGFQLTEALAGVSGFGLLTIPFHGIGITLQVHLVPDDEAGMLRFANMGEREYNVLRHFYRELITGRAVSMNRMIHTMDAPVELVPMHETPAERHAARMEVIPRPVRVLMALSFFAALAMLAYTPILSPAPDGARGAVAMAEADPQP